MPYKRKLPLSNRSSGIPEKMARTAAFASSGLPTGDLQRFQSLSRSVTNILTPRHQPLVQRSQHNSARAHAPPVPARKKEPTKREDDLVWSEEHHRSLVSAVYDIGMRHSSPSVILASMTLKPELLTGERLKSHLQKYRKSRVENKEKFMKQYDIGIARIRDGWKSRRRSVACGTSSWSSSTASHSMAPGEQIALLTYNVLHEKDANVTEPSDGGGGDQNDRWPNGHPEDLLKKTETEGIPIPNLTEQEKKTSVGKSLLLTLGMFRELRQHIQQLRQRSIPPQQHQPLSPASSSTSSSPSTRTTANTKEKRDAAAFTSSSPQRASSLIEQLASHCTEQYQKSKEDSKAQQPTAGTE